MQKLSTDSRPREVAYWIKRHIQKKHEPVIVTLTDYASRFVAWWKAIQPTWRVQSDGSYNRECPTEETWAGLGKGGSSGLYIVIVALSWWIRIVDPGDIESPVWMIVDDITWVLQQIQMKGATASMGKRARSGDASSSRGKRWCFVNSSSR